MLRHRNLVLGIIGASLVLAMLYLLIARKQYTAQAQVKIEPSGPRLIGNEGGGASEDAKLNFLNTQRAVMRSVKVLNDATTRDEVKDLDLLRKVRNRIAFVRDAVQIEVGKKESIVFMEVDAPDRKEAEILLGGVIQAYKDNEAQRIKKMSADLTTILKHERDACDGEIRTRTDRMLKLRQEAGTFSFESRDAVVVQTLQALKDAMSTAKLEAADADATYRSALAAYPTGTEEQDLLKQVENGSQFALATAAESSQFHQRIVETEFSLETAAALYGPEHPRVVGVRQHLGRLKAMFVVANRQRLMTALTRQTSIEAALAEQQKLANDYAAKADEHAKLATEVQRLGRQADILMDRMKQVAADERAAGLNIEVVQEPYADDQATKPSKARTAGMALMMGILIGIMAAYTREAFNPRMHQAEDVQMSLGLPILGTVPRMAANQTDAARSQKMRYDPLSEASEAFRIVRMALLAGAHGGARSFLITSPTESDGKTTLACNLAIAMAKAGERTLLIDAHFERPQEHRVFEVSTRYGLTGILLDGESLESAAQPSQIERLDILPCGPTVENPVELLNSERFVQFMEQMSRQYDRVIVDSSAVLEGSEPRIIASVADATVLVVRVGRNSRRQCEQAYDGLLSVGARLGGVVVNDVVRPHDPRRAAPLPPRSPRSLRAGNSPAGLLGERGDVMSDVDQ